MRIAKIISLLGLLLMGAAIANGFINGDFAREGAQLAAMPWGIVSLVDLYTGFTLFSMWIIYREKSLPAAVLWTVSMLTLGFFAGSLYALLALQASNGDWRKFLLGKNA